MWERRELGLGKVVRGGGKKEQERDFQWYTPFFIRYRGLLLRV